MMEVCVVGITTAKIKTGGRALYQYRAKGPYFIAKLCSDCLRGIGRLSAAQRAPTKKSDLMKRRWQLVWTYLPDCIYCLILTLYEQDSMSVLDIICQIIHI